MPLVKYIRNPSPDDNTGEVRLAGGRSLVRGGDALEVSAEELYAITANGYQLEVVDGSPAPAPETSSSPPTQSFGASPISTPSASPGA
jgi:hypothetical protein